MGVWTSRQTSYAIRLSPSIALNGSSERRTGTACIAGRPRFAGNCVAECVFRAKHNFVFIGECRPCADKGRQRDGKGSRNGIRRKRRCANASVSFASNALPAGMYVVVMRSGGAMRSVPVIVVR